MDGMSQIYLSLIKYYHPDNGPAPERAERTATIKTIRTAYRANDIATIAHYGAMLDEFPIFDVDSYLESIEPEIEAIEKLTAYELAVYVSEAFGKWLEQIYPISKDWKWIPDPLDRLRMQIQVFLAQPENRVLRPDDI